MWVDMWVERMKMQFTYNFEGTILNIFRNKSQKNISVSYVSYIKARNIHRGI